MNTEIPQFVEWHKGWAIIQVPNAYTMRPSREIIGLYLAVKISGDVCKVLHDVDIPDLKATIDECVRSR
jgi:hypothetical protein